MSVTGPGQKPSVCPAQMAHPADWIEKNIREVQKMVMRRTPEAGAGEISE